MFDFHQSTVDLQKLTKTQLITRWTAQTNSAQYAAADETFQVLVSRFGSKARRA